MPSSDAIAGRGGPCFYADDSTGDLFVVAGFAGQEMNDVHQFSAGDGSNVWKQVATFFKTNFQYEIVV